MNIEALCAAPPEAHSQSTMSQTPTKLPSCAPIALRGGDRNEETPTTENEKEVLMRRACARTLISRSFLLLEHSFQPTPSPLCGLASWLLLGACSMHPGEQFLT